MIPPPAISLARWSGRLPELRDEYRQNQPFPHVRLEDFLEPGVAEALAREFPAPDPDAWTYYGHYNVQKKYGNAQRASYPPDIRRVIEELNAPGFVAWLSALTGIEGLLGDPELEGAGLHQSERGAYLHIHADFTMHSHRPTWRRRLNLMVYLNDDWREDWNGQLELWDREMTRAERIYPPALNHCVIFSTSDDSFHGHPEPLRCPEGVTRKSIILYYYTVDDDPSRAARSTHYQPRPGDPLLKRALIQVDGMMLGAYYRLKRRFRFDDRIASRILGALRGRK